MTQPARTSFSIGFVALVAALALFAYRGIAASDRDADAEAPAVTLPQEVEVLLLRAGLEPEALAAVGVTSNTLSAQLAQAEDDLASVLAALGVADAEYAAARVERDRLQRLVQSGQGTQEDVVALVEAKAALADAEAARTAALDQAFAAATSNLSGPQRATLTKIRGNARWAWCPTQYRVLEQEEAAWLALRDALAGKRSHERIGDEAPAECLAHIAAVDQNQLVATAAENVDAHTASLQATWDATFVD